MTFDLKRMIESKKALRSKLAGFPLSEKLDMLDALGTGTGTLLLNLRGDRKLLVQEKM